MVEDIRDTRGGSAPRPRFYLPISQQTQRNLFDGPGSDSAQAVIIRTPPARAVAMAATIKTLVPNGQRATIEVITDRVNRALRPWRLGALLFSGTRDSRTAVSVRRRVQRDELHRVGANSRVGRAHRARR